MGSWKGVGALVGVFLALGLMFVLFSNSPQNTVRVIDDVPSENIGENTIIITSSGFTPNILTIDQGESVTFINEDGSAHWPATDIHPTHTEYPGSSIGKCGTGEESQIFDACHGLDEGESYSFTFNEVGTWNYHDHLRPGWTGTIIVE